MMVGVTKWKYSQTAIDERQADCDYYGDPSDNCKNEAWFIREMSAQFNEKFDLSRNFTFAFMDSFSQAGPAQNDQVQQEHWIKETSKLWTEATQRNETFDFKTIDDVLEENAACKEENQRLHDIIDEDIANLKEGVQHNADTISAVASNVSTNTKHIDDNSDEIALVSKNLTNLVQHNADTISSVAYNVAINSKRIDDNSDEIILVSTTLSHDLSAISTQLTENINEVSTTLTESINEVSQEVNTNKNAIDDMETESEYYILFFLI